MDAKTYLDILHTAEILKNQTRHSYTSAGRHESVAEHSWRLTLMAYFLKDEFPEADINKVIAMCMFHDVGEIFTGDIPTFLKNNTDEQVEEDQVQIWLRTLPDPYQEELTALFAEMKELKTAEAKLYKALDKMEAVIQHNEADISTWLPLEYDLQLNYGEKEVQCSDFTRRLKKAVDEETRNKIIESNTDLKVCEACDILREKEKE